MYGVDVSKEGSQAYYDSLLELYAFWEIDFLKVDDIANRENEADPYAAKAEIECIHRATDCTLPLSRSCTQKPEEAFGKSCNNVEDQRRLLG